MDVTRERTTMTDEERLRRQRKQEDAALWVSENATTGMLPSEMMASEGGDLDSFYVHDQDFSTDILSVSSGSDSEDGNTRRLADLLSRPDQVTDQPHENTRGGHIRPRDAGDSAPRTNVHLQRRPMPPQQYQHPNCSQTAFCGSPRRYVINSSGVGPRRYVINSHDIGANHYKLKLPGVSQDIDVKIGARPQFANDASQVLEKIDSMLREHHKNLEGHVMAMFDRQLNMI